MLKVHLLPEHVLLALCMVNTLRKPREASEDFIFFSKIFFPPEFTTGFARMNFLSSSFLFLFLSLKTPVVVLFLFFFPRKCFFHKLAGEFFCLICVCCLLSHSDHKRVKCTTTPCSK